MSHTPTSLCTRPMRAEDGRKWALAHLQDRYGRGYCKRPLEIFIEIAESRYPRPRRTGGFWILEWSESPDVTLDNVADVLNETIARYDAELEAV